MQLDTAESRRFKIPSELPEALRFLDKHGYVVFATVASASQCDIAHTLFWDWCESVSSKHVDRMQPNTWHNIPVQATTGIISTCGIGQSEFQWFLRTLPKVRQLFEAIWRGENALLVSYDGCGIFRPVAVDPMWKTDSGWYHVDQNPVTKPNQVCVQGLLSVFAQTAATGGLVVIPGSHKSFKKMNSLVGEGDMDDYLRLPSTWTDQLKQSPKLVTCHAGDFICWDSRTIHCNTPAIEVTASNSSATVSSSSVTPKLQRLVSYICMTPALPLDDCSLQAKRKRAAQAFETHSHWPVACRVSSKVTKRIRAILKAQAQKRQAGDNERITLITGVAAT